MAKKKKVSKVLEKNVCDSNGYCAHRVVGIKFAAMAFILFLITVWPALMDLVHRIHWGWFLGAMVLFGVGAANRNCCSNK